jgi:Prp8 binding protein
MQLQSLDQRIPPCLALWRTYAPNTNYGQLTALHKAPILDLQWSLTSPMLYTVSADRTMAVSDLTTGTRVRRIRAHTGVINSIDRTISGGTELMCTGADDGFIKVWEEGEKEFVSDWKVGCPVTAVCWSADGSQIYAGALDNEIHVRDCLFYVSYPPLLLSWKTSGWSALNNKQVFDLRKQAEVYTLRGHTDTPTSLSLSPLGTHLLSPSLSSQTIIHDIKPFCPDPTRIYRVLLGANFIQCI